MTGTPADIRQRLARLQERWSDPLLTTLTILLIILMFVVAPLQAAGIVAFQAFGFIIGFTLIVGVLILSASPTAAVVILIAVVMNGTAAVLRFSQPSTLDICLIAGAWLLIGVTLSWVVARAVFASGRVTYHRIIGAILLYLAMALTFAALFALVGVMVPGAFTGLPIEDNPALASNLIYFSFVTLTSTGYGDILPVHPVARSLCNLETIIGQFYAATLLARLVTLELEGRH
jgi:hypothetical protein